MRRIRCLSDLLELEKKILLDYMEYLKEEYYSLYNYLSNDEKLEKFVLESHRAMILLEEKGELTEILNYHLEIEFEDEVNLKNTTVLRIGVLGAEDVQLFYTVKNK